MFKTPAILDNVADMTMIYMIYDLWYVIYYFPVCRYEAAEEDFKKAIILFRGNHLINYRPLGLYLKLYHSEVSVNSAFSAITGIFCFALYMYNQGRISDIRPWYNNTRTMFCNCAWRRWSILYCIASLHYLPFIICNCISLFVCWL